MTSKQLTNREKAEFRSRRSMSKNVTKITWWLCEAISENTTNQGDRAGEMVALVVYLKRTASEVLYLRWFLCGEWISDGPAETIMVGEC